MIRLIASDLDGTLLPEGTPDLNPRVFEVIRKLQEKGITFVAASGRQYMSMKEVLQPLVDEIYFISDNGAYNVKKGEAFECRSFSKELLEEILTYIRGLKDVKVLVSAADASYSDEEDPEFFRWILDGYNLDMIKIDDLLQVKTPVVKVAMYCEKIDAAIMAEEAKKIFGEKASVMASGERWVDFMCLNVNKGAAIESLQKALGITKEETMAFGDNHNDISLLMAAGEGYAVANARPDLKKVAKYVLDDTEDAVLSVLESLL